MTSDFLIMSESRIDKLLLLTGAVLAVLMGTLLVKQSQNTELLDKSPIIGTIKTLTGVNRRHARALSWSRIEGESKLYLKDMIYTPPRSSAEVVLSSNEKLTLEPDSMVEFDSVSSDRFNIVLMQGAAKLVSVKGTTQDVERTPKDFEVRLSEVQKPQLPVFFIDTKSWENTENDLMRSLSNALKSITLLSENSLKTAQTTLNSVMDYQLNLAPAKIVDSSQVEGPWYKLSWSPVPVKGTVYEVEMSRNPSFSSLIKQETEEAFLDVQFLESGTHFWRVIAKGRGERIQSPTETFSVPPIKRGLSGTERE